MYQNTLLQYTKNLLGMIIVGSLLFILTTHFASAAETETIKIYGSSGDGRIQTPLSLDWDYQHDVTSADLVFDSDTGVQAFVNTVLNNDYQTLRGFFVFDTSSIPEGVTITDVSLYAYPYKVHNDDNDELAYLGLYEGLQESPLGLLGTDVDNCGDSLDNPTLGSNKLDLDDITENNYTSFELNTTGRSWVNTEGYTKICVREGHDVEDQPIEGGIYTYSGVRFRSSEMAGTEKDPYLEVTYTVDSEPENQYPLYTQIESEYPSLMETQSWADDVYADGGSYWCGSTIAGCGCAITSMTMLGRYTGATTDVLGNDVNPGNMNAYLQSDEVDGYSSEATVKWLSSIAYMSELTPAGLLSRLSEPVFTPKHATSGQVMAQIDAALADGDKGVLGFANGHFVWVTEKTADGYLVNDPWWYNTKTADDDADEANNVRDYNNVFDSARIFTIADELEALPARSVEAIVHGTAELLYEDVAGDKAGYENGSLVFEVAGASYGEIANISLVGGAPELAGGHLLVPDASETFTIQVIGTGSGTYEFEVLVLNGSGQVETYAFSGQTIPGVVSTFEFDLATGEVTELPIDYEQFVDILDILLGDATPQQRAFFQKRAEKLFATMEEKTVSQALQQVEVYRTLLQAKKVSTPTFLSVLDRLKAQVKAGE